MQRAEKIMERASKLVFDIFLSSPKKVPFVLLETVDRQP